MVLLLLALLLSGCSDDPEPPSDEPKPSAADETRGTGVIGLPAPATTEEQILERVRRGVATARAAEPIPGATFPSVVDLKSDYCNGGPDCPPYCRSNGRWELCARGDVDGRRTLVVIDDSHARQWGSPLDILAESEGYAAYHLVRLGCPGQRGGPRGRPGRRGDVRFDG